MRKIDAPIAGRLKWLPRVLFRRRFVRFEIDGTYLIRDVTTGTDVALLDISFGGFRSTSSVDLRPGALHTFQFPLRGREAEVLTARVVHCYAVSGQADPYTVGWIWTNVPTNVDGIAIGAVVILDYLTSEHSPVVAVKK